MKQKFKVYNDYFEHNSNNRERSDGWAKITLAMSKKFDLNFSVLQVKGKYQNLTRKFCDNCATGSETKKTGNKPINVNNTRDEEFNVISPYFLTFLVFLLNLDRPLTVLKKNQLKHLVQVSLRYSTLEGDGVSTAATLVSSNKKEKRCQLIRQKFLEVPWRLVLQK